MTLYYLKTSKFGEVNTMKQYLRDPWIMRVETKRVSEMPERKNSKGGVCNREYPKSRYINTYLKGRRILYRLIYKSVSPETVF